MNPYQTPTVADTLPPPLRREDPVLISSRREALVVLAVWIGAFAWTIGYCAFFGYQTAEIPTLIMGVPAWVLWGIFVPWGVCTLLSTLMAWLFMADDDLGIDSEDPVDAAEALLGNANNSDPIGNDAKESR